MRKEAQPIFLKVLVISIVFLFATLIITLNQNGIKLSSSGITGFSVSNISNSYNNISNTTKIFLLGQWAAVIIMLALAFIRDNRVVGKRNELEGLSIKRMSEGTKTDLDTVYNILKDKKQLRLSTISNAFKISKETAMDWCKTLESANLAVIEYPGMGEPFIRVK